MWMIDVCFFFKQKTAYEMRISDWSSDVCSSDLRIIARGPGDKTPVALHNRAGIADALLERRSARNQLAHQVLTSCSYISGLKPTSSLSAASSTGRLIIDGCAIISAIALSASSPSRSARSEERRVGKEGGSPCGTRGSPYHSKKK